MCHFCLPASSGILIGIMRMPYTRKELIGIAIVILFFAVAQYYARLYAADIQGMVGTEDKTVGMIAYGSIAILAIVVAPISSLPLVPIAAAVWGSFATAVVTVIAWTAGSIIAFVLARVYGKRIIGKVVDMESMRKLESVIGERNLFTSTLLLRMIVPVDILSYALGLFSTIRIVPYSIATMIGIVPFILFFSYAIQIPIYWQGIIALSIIGSVVGILKIRR